METDKFDQQLHRFEELYHIMLSMDQSLGLEDKFPNFICLSPNEITVIDMVAKNPDIIMKDICTALSMPKSTLTNMVNRLERSGYITRTITRKDLRSYGLALTDKGITTQKEHAEYEQFVFGGALMTLEPEEREELIRIMDKIIKGVRCYCEE